MKVEAVPISSLLPVPAESADQKLPKLSAKSARRLKGSSAAVYLDESRAVDFPTALVVGGPEALWA